MAADGPGDAPVDPPPPPGGPAADALATAWEALGTHVDGPNGRVWTARIPASTDRGNPPLLALHGFPTNALDWQPVLERLRADRDVVVVDVHGFGLSTKPDHRYSIRGYADDVEAAIAHHGLAEVDLLTHDMGDTVGGELLARTLDGALSLAVRRRVVTNGSIYIDMAQLTLGQQLLLGLPDAKEPLVGADAGSSFRGGVVGTFAADTVLDADGHDHLDAVVTLARRDDGLAMLPRTIRYIEDRRAEERRFTGAIEEHASPVGIVWGDQDPVAVHAMAERFAATRTDAPVRTLEGVGHYPMVEAPERFADAVLALLDEELAR